MNLRTYCLVSGSIFSFVAVVHFIRILSEWPLIVGTIVVPAWLSGLAVIFLGFMAITAFTIASKMKK